MMAAILGWLVGKVSFAAAHGAAEALADAIRQMWVDADYKAAMQDIARYEAEAAAQKAKDATNERMETQDAAMGDNPDPAAMRERLRNRNPASR